MNKIQFIKKGIGLTLLLVVIVFFIPCFLIWLDCFQNVAVNINYDIAAIIGATLGGTGIAFAGVGYAHKQLP